MNDYRPRARVRRVLYAPDGPSRSLIWRWQYVVWIPGRAKPAATGLRRTWADAMRAARNIVT